MSQSLQPLRPAASKQDKGALEPQQWKPRGPACDACRTSKLKCNGGRPSCQSCLARKIFCEYVETDHRRAKRNYSDVQELRKKLSTHEELVNLLTSLPEQDSVRLLHRLRTERDLAATLNHYKTSDLLLQMHLVPETRLRYELPYSRDMPLLLMTSGSPYLGSMIHEAASQRALCPQADSEASTGTAPVFPELGSSVAQSPYVKPYHAAVLVEPRLERTKPSEWTTVCKDDSLMRDMLANYFAHDYHSWPVFHKDYFLEDMANPQTAKGKTSCCSAMLVNATLAHAYHSYKQLPSRYRYWDPENLGYRFFAEAKRLWELSAHKRRGLTSIQTAMIINTIYNIYGLDKLGSLYGQQSFTIAEEIRLFDGNEHVSSERQRHARNFTAWCLFNIDSHVGFQFLRPPCLAVPLTYPLPDPSINLAWYGEVWCRYPQAAELYPMQFGYCFKAMCDFRIIMAELCQSSFGGKIDRSTEAAMTFVRRFSRWFRALPTPLKPKYIVHPAQFLLHIEYHLVVMIICQPFIGDEWDEEHNPRKTAADAERDLNVLLRLYYFRHGFSEADMYLTSPLSKLGFICLQKLKRSDRDINDSLNELEYLRSSLLLALEGLRNQGRNYYTTRTIYYIIQNQLRPEEARFLAGTEDSVSAADEQPALFGKIQSAWTPGTLNMFDDPVEEELSKLAKKYLTFEIGADDDDGSGDEATPSASVTKS